MSIQKSLPGSQPLLGLDPQGSGSQSDELKPRIRVYLLRQITVVLGGFKTTEEIVIGEGSLWPVSSSSPLGDEEGGSGVVYERESMDWGGEVKCNENVMVGSFHADGLQVKDLMVLEVKPYSHEGSPFLVHRHSHLIRIVTDTASVG